MRPVTAPSAVDPLATLGADLKLWLRADVGVTVTGAGVSQWSDQSGNANHAVQATDANRPIYELSAGKLGVVVDQDRHLTIPDAASLRTATGKAWGIYAALRSSDGGGGNAVIGKWAPTPEWALLYADANTSCKLFVVGSGGTGSIVATVDCTTGDETICHAKMAVSHNLYVGSLGAWGAAAALSGTPVASTSVVCVGRHTVAGGGYGVADLREIIMYQKTGNITRAEDRAILAWLRSRWGTP